MPFKLHADHRHQVPKQKHKVTNWSAYEAGLRPRGSPTVWFTEAAIAALQAEPRMTPGGQRRYSALAIITALTLRAVFRLALRQMEGLIGSIVALLGLHLAIPDHTTMSRRAEALENPQRHAGDHPVHLLVDSTGLRLCGPDEWLVEKHGSRVRRSSASLVLCLLLPSSALGANAASATMGPPRALTDPTSIVSRAKPDAGPVSLANLFYVRGGMDGVWMRDGSNVVVSTNLTGRYNLWTVPAERGFPLQLTQSDDRQSGLTTSPNGRWLVYQSDHAGDEMYDLYTVALAGGEVADLTATPEVSESGALFSPDGAILAFRRRLKSAPTTDIAVMDFATRKVRLLTHETAPDQSWSVVAFTDGGRKIIANRVNYAGTIGSVWSLDIASGAATALTASSGAYILASDATADGRLVAMTAEQGDGTRQAALFDTVTHGVRELQPDPWEQSSGHFSPDGETLLFTRNVDGHASLYAYAVGSGAIAEVALPTGVNSEASENQSSFSPDGRRILLTHQASNTSLDYWIADLSTGKSDPLTRLGLAGIDPARLPSAQVVHYASQDGTVISALLWTPFNLTRDGHAPGVVLPHGGPTAQTVDSFNRTALALASRGYMVIAPNPRGSTGYGRAFEEANRNDLGGGDLIDEVYGARFMASTGYVDLKAIGISGGSYGGYMTMMAAAKTPDLWAAAVEEYGIIDWFAMYAHEEPTLQQYQMSLIGDPVKNKAVYTAASPLTYIHSLSAPLLVLQGDNDIRVPKGQAMEVTDLLKRDGRTVDAHYYPNEGHGFVKRENQIDALERTVAWFDKYLKRMAAPASQPDKKPGE